MLDSMTFELAYRQYAGRLTGLSRKLTNGSADAEDVAQDAWIEAWKARCTIDAQGMWKWLCRVLRRLWWHRLNRAGKKRDGFTVPLETAFDEPSPNDQHGDAQRTQIAEAANDLGGAQRDAVHMALNGFDGADIAHARGTSLSAATLSIRLAVKRLRQRWGLE